MEFELGHTYSGYKILDIVKRSRSAVQYRVQNTLAQRVESLQTLTGAAVADPDASERFLREVRIRARLSHPHILTFYTAVPIEGHMAMTTELPDSLSLADRLLLGPLPWREAIEITRQLLDAVNCLHQQSFVHCDITPEIILFAEGSFCKLADFSQARPMDPAHNAESGAVVGNPRYISPEQVKSERSLDQRSDLYSLGVVLYEMLCGRPPFESRSQFELMMAHVHQAPLAPSAVNAKVPQALDSVVMKALSKERDGRYQSAEEFAAALGELAGGADVEVVVEPESVVVEEPEPVGAEPEALACAQPEVVAAAEPVVVALAEPEALAAVEPEIVAFAEPEALAVAEPQVVAVAEAEVAAVAGQADVCGPLPHGRGSETDVMPSAELGVSSEAVAVLEPETMASAAPEVVLAAEPDVPAVSEPELSTVAETELGLLTQPESVAVAEPEIVAVAEPEVLAATEPELPAVSEPEIVAVAEPEVLPVAEPEVLAVVEPETVDTTEPEVVADAEPEIVPAAEPEVPASAQLEAVSLAPDIVAPVKPEAAPLTHETVALVEPEVQAATEPEVTAVTEPVAVALVPEIVTVVEPEAVATTEPEMVAVAESEVAAVACEAEVCRPLPHGHGSGTDVTLGAENGVASEAAEGTPSGLQKNLWAAAAMVADAATANIVPPSPIGPGPLPLAVLPDPPEPTPEPVVERDVAPIPALMTTLRNAPGTTQWAVFGGTAAFLGAIWAAIWLAVGK